MILAGKAAGQPFMREVGGFTGKLVVCRLYSLLLMDEIHRDT